MLLHWLQQLYQKNQRFWFAAIFWSFSRIQNYALFSVCFSWPNAELVFFFSWINYWCQRALILITHYYTTSNEDVYLNEWGKRFATHSNGQHQQSLGNTKYRIRKQKIQNTDEEIWMNGRQAGRGWAFILRTSLPDISRVRPAAAP